MDAVGTATSSTTAAPCAPQARSGPVGPAGELERVRRSLEALERWHRTRVREEAGSVSQRSREQRLDLSRRMDVLRAQHAAIVERSDAQLRATALVLRHSSRPRVLVVHRNEWFRDKVSSALLERDVEVIGRLSNGAEAVGVVVAEQPDLVLVEDALPMLTGELVVRQVREYVPWTTVAAQVAHEDGVAAMLEAGAAAAWPRRVPPADVVEGLLALLHPAVA